MASFKTKVSEHLDDIKNAEKIILPNVGKILRSDIRRKMMDQVDVNNNAYTPLSNQYAKYVYSTNPTYKTLVSHSGKLFNSINWEIIGSTLRIYSDSEYGMYHNEGTDHIPQRQFIPDENSEMIKDAFKKAIIKFINDKK